MQNVQSGINEKTSGDGVLQGTPEWFAARLGKVTASRVADMTAKTKSGYSASRANYAAELICERLTGAKTEKFMSAAMLHGTEQEPAARAMYEFMTDSQVELVGFIDHGTIDMSGASPDGFVGEDGMIEIKCPGSAVHIATLLGSEIDGRYQKQIAWQFACCPYRKWCDFVSFDPRLPPEMQLFVKRVERDDAMISELEKEARTFLAEIDATIAKLTSKYLQKEAAE